MTGKLLEINLFGPCSVQSTEPGGFAITGAKHRALFALLATAPFGRRTRSFLQETLWGTACYDTGRQSLRRALADIKDLMGESYGALLSVNNTEVGLNLSRVQFVGHVNTGPFLEGLNVHERGFVQWVSGVRQNPGQLAALFGFSHALIAPILPVVSVLPFRAVGGEELDSVLGDWLAEEICRSLSR